MIIKLLMAGLLVATSFHVEYTLETLVIIMLFFSLIYYKMAFGLSTGLFSAALLTEWDDIRDSFVSVLIHFGAFVVIFFSEYQLYSIFLLPWLILSATSLVFAYLVHIEFLEIQERNDEDDEA